MVLPRHDAAVKAFVTGGAGFIGLALVRQLLARDAEVVALVRDAGRADELKELGATLVEGDLAALSVDQLTDALAGTDAVFHVAGVYRVGIPESAHASMFAANVAATRSVLDAAVAAGVRRIVYVSTGNVFGNTRGQVVDETYRRPQPPEYLSYYDETKYLAHLAAEERIATGAPIVIAMPGLVYGPGDHSQAGGVINQALRGTLSVVSAGNMGGSFVHVEDVATGILLVHDRGAVGQSYILAGEVATLGEVVRRASALAGQKPPGLSAPDWLLKGLAPIGGLIGPALGGSEPNVAETIRASIGVTYWVSSEKAKRELGYAPRDLESGLRTMLPPAR
jgi:nucleoside-diphosphate-sugar epimerase